MIPATRCSPRESEEERPALSTRCGSGTVSSETSVCDSAIYLREKEGTMSPLSSTLSELFSENVTAKILHTATWALQDNVSVVIASDTVGDSDV